MQVHDLLEITVKTFPYNKAVWYKDEWISYYDLNKAANKIAAFLVECGIRRGDKVSILFENSINYIKIYFGILKAGAVVVGLNTDTNIESLTYLLKNSESRAIFASKKSIKHLTKAIPKCPEIKNVFTDTSSITALENIKEIKIFSLADVYSGPEMKKKVRTIDIDIAEIVYTSGSTGKPKGVMLTHLNLVSNMKSIRNYLNLNAKDRVMVILPFYYIYGKSLLLTHVLTGGSVVIDNRFVYPNKVLDTMKETGVTGFAGVPSTFMILLNRSKLQEMNIESLRYITQAGGAMAPAVQKEVVKAFEPAEVYIMYGATEAAPRLSWLDPKLLFSKWGSIGIPVDNVDLLIVDDEGNELPRGEIGEIAARGSNIMRGYWKDPKGTKEVLKHGMYFTGDLGKQDKDGYFYIVGRTKDIIKVKGFRIGAKEIEETILEIEEVHETAVVGIEDSILGEAILALIIPKKSEWSDSKKVLNYLKDKLPLIKVPKYIEFRNEFPKNESGKVMKTMLKEQENKIKRY